MNSSSGKASLGLKTKNFGPIIEANMELRPLTVFVGPSNTGKSYLAILIYALHRYFGFGRTFAEKRYRSLDFALTLPLSGPHSRNWRPTRETVAAVNEIAPALASRQHIRLPEPIVDSIHSEIEAQGESIAKEICRCFGFDKIGALVRRGSKGGSKISLRRAIRSDSKPHEYEVTFGTYKRTAGIAIPERMPVHISKDRSTRDRLHLIASQMIYLTNGKDIEVHRRMILQSLYDMFLDLVIAPLDRRAFYLPADRTGVMHAHRVVVRALIESAATSGLRPTARTPALSGVMADFLEQLLEIDRPSNPGANGRSDLVRGIETAILGGSVGIDRSSATGYPHFTYRPDGWARDLSLTNASSMVSELAPLVLYLRHAVAPGDVLIIEEPESHLHPAMQVEFTRQIATLVGAGIRVIVTTHSEWLLEELGNVVRRSALPENAREAVALEPEQVGVWLFEPKRRPRGSHVKEIRIDESGLYPSGFDEVAAALHNDWADISSRSDNPK